VLRVSALVEKLGIPTASIIGSGFVKQAETVAKGLGVPLPMGIYPGPPMVDSAEELERKVAESVAPGILAGLTGGSAREQDADDEEPTPGAVVLRGGFDEIQDYFYRQLWTDGMPIVPPTRERVDAFLAFTDHPAGKVIRVLPQEGREASIYSVAVHGVMAGCRPEYMPVLVALVEAISDPHFRIEDAGSTPGWEPLIIVSGPVVKDLDFNAGQGVMRVGRQANTTLGRFLRLYMRNICGYRIPPGAGDKGSIAQSFLVALAEDEDSARDIGWTSFGEDCGYTREDSVVTITSVNCISPPVYSSGDHAENHVQQFVDVLGRVFAYWSQSGVKRGYWFPLIVIGPGVAKVIAREWTKDEVRQFIWKRSTIPASLMAHFAFQTGAWTMDLAQLVREGTLPEYYASSDDPDREVPIIVRPGDIGLVVAGDADRNQSRGYMSNNTQGSRTSRKIVFPKNWSERLKQIAAR
jgi:hypothetical protein